MRNSKTLELFESFKKEFEKEDEVLNECELPSTEDGTAKKEIEDQLERTRKRKEEIGIEESEEKLEESEDIEYIAVSDSDPQNENEYFDNRKEAVSYCKEMGLDRVIKVNHDKDTEECVFENDLDESEQLNEKINKDNAEINKILANPNLGKNKEKIKSAGYEIDNDTFGQYIENPKTNKKVYPKHYNKDKREKVDFKGKLDSDRENKDFVTIRDYSNRIPKSEIYHKR